MQRKILVSCVLARWTYAWNVRRKRSASSWVWQLAAPAATTRRYTRVGDRRTMCSWTKKWCRRQSTRLSRKEEAAVLRISARCGNTRPPVNRPPRFFKGKFLDRVINRCTVGQRPRRPSALQPRERSRATTRIQIPRAGSIPRGGDPRNCRHNSDATSVAKTRGSNAAFLDLSADVKFF